VNVTKAEREELRARAGKPGQAVTEIVKNVRKTPTLSETALLASGIRNWKRLMPHKRPDECIYTGSAGDTELTVTSLATPTPRYVVYLSNADQPGYLTFVTPKDSKEAEIPERMTNTAVLHLLRERLPQWLENKLR
jgi:hypothetical protein